MKYCMNHRGMTLVELMVVVGISAILAAILAFVVTGNKNANAQSDMFNEVHSLFQAQRMRATSLSLSTYVRFTLAQGNVSVIEPRIGVSSSCSLTDTEQIPIRYTADVNNNVAIDAVNHEGGNRTLDSLDSKKYVHDGEALTSLVIQKRIPANGFLDGNYANVDGNSFAVCFQPNGQIMFIEGAAFATTVTEARIQVGIPDNSNNAVGGNYFVALSSMGMIYTEAVAN